MPATDFSSYDLFRKAGWSSLAPVRECASYRGWSLGIGEYEDGDGFTTPFYVAVHEDGRSKPLNLSRFDFTPTQDRWQWLVDNRFPDGTRGPSGTVYPLNDESIDAAIERAGLQVAA